MLKDKTEAKFHCPVEYHLMFFLGGIEKKMTLAPKKEKERKKMTPFFI